MTIKDDYIESSNAIQKDYHETAKNSGFWDVQSAKDWMFKEFNEGMGFGPAEQSYTYKEMIRAYEAGQKNPPPNIPEKLMLIVSEIAEAMEAYRNGDLMSEKIPKFKNFIEELGDADIRMKDLCEYLEQSQAEAEIAKSEYNKTRPYKHGKKT